MDLLIITTGISALLAVAALAYMRFEAGNLKVERIHFSNNKDCLKVIQLSDIHIKRMRVKPEVIRRVIETEQPDLVIFTGDYIEKKSHKLWFLKFLRDIKSCKNMFLCMGNHDYQAFQKDKNGLQKFIKDIEHTGINVLENRCVPIQKNSRSYNLIGIGDMRYNNHKLDKAFLGCGKAAAANIGFTHNPDVVLLIPEGKLNYLFSGHFHGGQIWTPFGFEFKVLRKEKLCRMGIKSGLHNFNGINLYINRGLGNVCFPLRFMSRPEITVFYIP